MKTKPTLSFARLLRSLLTYELNYADFQGGNRRQLDQFISDNVLDYRLIGSQQRRIFCHDGDNLAKYLHNKFEIPSLDGYIEFLEKEEFQRSDSVLAASDSKLRKTRVFTGFLLNSFEEIMCELQSQPFLIKPVKGTFTFISAYHGFRIPPDVIVVIVEGHENFREIQRQEYLFGEMKPLFVWRYQNSNAIAEWLNFIPNKYLHFGDFDPKGIHIYLSEFKNKISGDRGRFFVPSNVGELLPLYGEKNLYEKQIDFLPHIRLQHEEELTSLIELILIHKKGLAQEILIR